MSYIQHILILLILVISLQQLVWRLYERSLKSAMLTANTNLVTSRNPFMFVSNILDQTVIALDEAHEEKI